MHKPVFSISAKNSPGIQRNTLNKTGFFNKIKSQYEKPY